MKLSYIYIEFLKILNSMYQENLRFFVNDFPPSNINYNNI
jgi:hypothetical protein